MVDLFRAYTSTPATTGVFIYLGPPEKVCGGQTDNELIPNQTETYGSSWGDLNI
jgi:hypothetical protein